MAETPRTVITYDDLPAGSVIGFVTDRGVIQGRTVELGNNLPLIQRAAVSFGFRIDFGGGGPVFTATARPAESFNADFVDSVETPPGTRLFRVRFTLPEPVPLEQRVELASIHLASMLPPPAPLVPLAIVIEPPSDSEFWMGVRCTDPTPAPGSPSVIAHFHTIIWTTP